MINEVPEIAYAVENLSRQLAGPSEMDMQDLRQCVRYTLGHSDEWLFLTVQDKPRKTNEVATINVFTEADWAGDIISVHEDRWIHHWSERTAAGHAHASSTYVRAILDDPGMQAKINLRCDAKAAKTLAQRQGLSKRTRHVKVKYLYVQDLVKAREVEVSRVATETNLEDIGTKHMPSHRLEFLKSLMGKKSSTR